MSIKEILQHALGCIPVNFGLWSTKIKIKKQLFERPRHMWVEFVLLIISFALRRFSFFNWVLRFPLFPKINFFKSQLHQDWQTKNQYVDVLPLNHYFFVFLFCFLLLLLLSSIFCLFLKLIEEIQGHVSLTKT